MQGFFKIFLSINSTKYNNNLFCLNLYQIRGLRKMEGKIKKSRHNSRYIGIDVTSIIIIIKTRLHRLALKLFFKHQLSRFANIYFYFVKSDVISIGFIFTVIIKFKLFHLSFFEQPFHLLQ